MGDRDVDVREVGAISFCVEKKLVGYEMPLDENERTMEIEISFHQWSVGGSDEWLKYMF
jgi:hypothetical protein